MEDLTALTLYLAEFKQKYYKPILEAGLKQDINTIKDRVQYDKQKSLLDKEVFLRGFIENIEFLIEKCNLNESDPISKP